MEIKKLNKVEINKTLITCSINDCVNVIGRACETFEETKHDRDKSLIIYLFNKTDNKCKEDIKLRIRVIDSLYFTNIDTNNKEGLEILVHRIHQASIGKFEQETFIKQRFIDFFDKHNSENNFITDKKNCEIRECQCTCNGDKAICQIIHDKNDKKKAMSLATKYAYFLTGQKFPIYDRFVRKICRILSQEEPVSLAQIKKMKTPEMSDNFFETMREISRALGKNGVDKFDAFCWVWGKISESKKNGMVSTFDENKNKCFLSGLEGVGLVKLSEEEKAWVEQRNK